MWYNPFMEWILNSPIHGLLSGSNMVIYYKGKVSGKIYHLPVGYVRRNKTLITVSYKQRTWWRNLRGGAAVTILLMRKMLPAYAQVIEDAQGVSLGLADFIGASPAVARMLGVEQGKDGKLDRVSLEQATLPRVIVHTTID